jgi:hypothetical protein
MSKKPDAPFSIPDWPDAAKNWKLDKIVPYPKNARTHPPGQIKLLASMLTRWGPDQPIVVDEMGVILKGHGRLQAARAAGFEEFPVVQRKGMPPAEKKAMRLADNQVALLSGWDSKIMKDTMTELKGYDIPLLGFSNTELKSYGVSLGEMPPTGIATASPFQQITFSLDENQIEAVKEAMDVAKALGDFSEETNPNNNGNAIARVCKMFIEYAYSKD